MKLERQDIEENLPDKGFEVNRSGHHIYFHHTLNGKKTGPYTYVSHGSKYRTIDSKGGIITSMKKQLKLSTNSQVADLVNCPMDGQEYVRVLQENKVITENDG